MPRARRSTKVCARCRKRKTKCDFKFPACTTCKLTNVTCFGFDPANREAVPRSLVKSLEARVTEFEVRMLEFQAAPQNLPYLVTSALAQATISVGIPSGGSFLSSKVSSASFFRSSCPPLAVVREKRQSISDDSMVDSAEKQPKPNNPANKYNSGTPINLNSVPLPAINRMIRNYVDTHLPQYPCLSASMLDDIVHQIQHEKPGDTDSLLLHGIPTASGLGHFEYLALLVALAISSMTLTWKADDQARAASESFYNSAIKHLQVLRDHSEIQALQISLLLAHYAHMCPERADNWTCIANAIRIVMNLGLYMDCPDDIVGEEARQRNELFWVAYGMERSLCTNLRLPLSLPQEAITAKLSLSESFTSIPPAGTVNRNSVAYHICRYRALETEVHRVLHLEEDLHKFGSATIEEWIERITQRLKTWYEKAQSYSKYDMLEFKNVQLYHLLARIHRPTPRLRLRGPEDRKIVLDSSLVLIEDYLGQERRRSLFYPWHGVHILFETAVIALEACWSSRDHGVLHDQAKGMLEVKIPQCLQLLTNIGQRWDEAAVCADRLRPLVQKVMAAFGCEGDGLFSIVDEEWITTEIQDLLFTDGPLTWNRSAPGEDSFGTNESDPMLFNNLGDNNIAFFSWDPDWDVMPSDPILE
ncbi:hypothetical protein BO71DRAFT_478484 [Aspergillus ellipticus CBS 707.79]|uniref:Zn(2)-C6 fungal-type domain-containing protein n=1 Tax=Aspergillus ellipticus CBS 707.79 TaxID=1448320 RepID=A0A319DGJ3_9EURO|nr:hypothetical protein BO71DRAFT_478484 [Aspergillus ellipticus CBS 707.79]